MNQNKFFSKNYRALFVTWFSVVAVGSSPVQASINTASIMASSASTSCLDYKIVGTCFWLFCTKFGCKVRTSTKVRHYIPEVVVSSYNNAGQNPWSEMNLVSSGHSSGGEYQTPEKNYTQLNFKNVDAIGHPQGAVSEMLNGTGYYCKSQTTTFMPYYLSSLDFFAWRMGVPEMMYPEALTPGMREIRAGGDTWGNIYPRAGAVTQVHDYKAAAVAAHRAADVFTRNGQPHIYLPIAQNDNPSNGQWFPKPVEEGKSKTHKWQQLSPEMSQSCSVFPDNLPSFLSDNGSYAWALWRPYKCCKKRGQTFLYSVDWFQD